MLTTMIMMSYHGAILSIYTLALKFNVNKYFVKLAVIQLISASK